MFVCLCLYVWFVYVCLCVYDVFLNHIYNLYRKENVWNLIKMCIIVYILSYLIYIFFLLFTLLRLVLIWTNMCWKKLLTKGVSHCRRQLVCVSSLSTSLSFSILSFLFSEPPCLFFFLYLWVSNCEMCSCCFRVPPFHARPCYILKEQTCVALQIPHVTLVRFDLRSERESHPFTSL